MKGFFEPPSNRVALDLKRATARIVVEADETLPEELRPDGSLAWMSNGGSSRTHPARSLPFSLELPLQELGGEPVRVEMVGVFARFADSKVEPSGTIGASIQVRRDEEIAFRQDLIQGRHYRDASQADRVDQVNGDGSSLATVGTVTVEGAQFGLDRLSIDLPPLSQPNSLVVRDLGSPASFVVLGVWIEVARQAGCPFHSKSGLIPLREVGAIVRVGDRRRFSKALAQLQSGIEATDDLDEARGQALTFLAVVTAGMLESGGSRELHRIQLEAARKLDRLGDNVAIAQEVIAQCERIAEPLFATPDSPSSHLVDRALAIVDRNFARPLSDEVVAEQLGLSTSHFRFLFKQATGSPFHKYLIAVRLEKARQLLLEQGLPVSQVAAAVGFTGLSHFSRAFTHRFSASPTTLRRQKR
jgi:AraC-like DNA-binding protein